jgi:tripartite-type tricarboxylate transporter receptor subunit TctC
MPDTPTFAELGFPGFETSTWFSLFAPRGTPAEIIDQLNLYTRTVHDDPETKRRLDANFVDPLTMTAAEFAAQVKADAVKWERVVRETGAKLE